MPTSQSEKERREERGDAGALQTTHKRKRE